ncbi:ABC transporter permease [Bacillus cereus]|uniref:Bacitracin ABC transporter, permease n=1 Tax=Bacillus thuringiensis subsp. konkukian (strain 97-27) TaxID=281309 RepID=Q6HLI9_BACHK|nr:MULTISPECIES: ABC transporter permease [Bacillus cereus group]AAT63071.1 bacitracin ABC transporter, permease [[Bacillus thuringiensis] serovar konkukian str. 97-27]AJI36618.1 ABC-2 transporter family protein [Bacillus thuringiensis]OOZ95432.1 ABC transporter permease [Bacillus cereus]PRC99247.1 ABC transporter permease [Bacillus cereus]PRD04582.1 ABC transporter permease [Bacillus cereus]
MLKLIQNEFLKLHAKKGMYILIGVIAVLEILGVLAMLKWGDGTEFKGSYLDFASSEIGLITLFATIFGITIASRMITDEFQKGTIKQLLIRPRKRMTVLFSKYITVLLTIIFIIFASTLIAMIIGGIVMDGSKTELTLGIVMKSTLYQVLSPFFFATLAFFLANVFRKSVLPLIITLFFFFLQQPIKMMLMMLAKGSAKFVVLFHLNLNVYDGNKLINRGAEPPFTEFTFTTSLLLVITYIVVLLIASSALFQKRDVL